LVWFREEARIMNFSGFSRCLWINLAACIKISGELYLKYRQLGLIPEVSVIIIIIIATANI
jgi:hypothetical protein